MTTITTTTTVADDSPQAPEFEAVMTDKIEVTAAAKSGERRESRRTSFTRRLSAIFKTSGENGASVVDLRGNTGSDFEGYASVQRSSNSGIDNIFGSSCCGGGGCFNDKTTKQQKFILIKGYHCFVFDTEHSTSPKYAIELINRNATIIEMSSRPGSSTNSAATSTLTKVNLETKLGDKEYEFIFPNETVATQFISTVSASSANAAADQVRQRLGHGKLLSKRASVRFAQQVGAKKTKDQPEMPVSTSEIMAAMPSSGYH
jgi:hypothetical protein